MKNLIEKIAKTPIILKKSTGSYSDGHIVYETVEARGFICAASKAELDEFGAVRDMTVIYVAPLDNTPELPVMAVINGKEFVVEKIMVYRNMRSEEVGYKLLVAGAA